MLVTYLQLFGTYLVLLNCFIACGLVYWKHEQIIFKWLQMERQQMNNIFRKNNGISFTFVLKINKLYFLEIKNDFY